MGDTIQIAKSIQQELEKNPKWKLMLYLQEKGETPVYSIAKELKWTTGKAHASVKALLKSKTITARTITKNGRAVKLAKLIEE